MIYIEPDSLDCAFHFAAEEYVMSLLRPAEPVLMLWRTDRTVMLGANQIAEIEADLAYARENGIAVVRRSSGGGTIYTDCGTLLYTIILPYADTIDTKSVIRDYLAGPAIGALREMGLSASLEGRNDILVDGKKISGIAQYIKYGYLCSHGSLLFDANLEELVRVLIANDEKIRSKALRSIKSRVTNIAEHLPRSQAQSASTGIAAPPAAASDDGGSVCAVQPGSSDVGLADGGATGILGFMHTLKGNWDRIFGLAEYKFSESDLAGIEKIRAEKYGADEWTFGHTPRYSYRNSVRFQGGTVEVFAEIKNGAIAQVKITGDFLALRPVAEIEQNLTGIPFRKEAIAAALAKADVQETLGSITKPELLSVFG